MGNIPNLKPQELEKRVQERLDSEDINSKVKELRKGGRNHYTVYPPLSVKDDFNWDDLYKMFLYDVWNRFKSMESFNVRNGLGYDPYNLRVERSVLEELEDEQKVLGGLPEEKWDDIIEKMDKKSDEFKEEMMEQLQALGLWRNLEFEYDTRTGSFMDSVWWTIKELMDKGLLIKEEKPVTWCPRCKSSMANTEILKKEHTKEKALLKVPTSGKKERYFLVEIENPWMLPSGMSIAAHPSWTYSVVKYVPKDGKTTQLLMKEDKVEEMMERGGIKEYEILNEVEGEKLDGLKFKYPLHDKISSHTKKEGKYIHKIVCSEKIDEEGTGLVLLTPPHNEKHWKIAKKEGLSTYNPIGKHGHFNSGVRYNKYSGLSASQTDQIILDDLESKDLLLSRKKEKKEVKFCAACLNKVVKIPHREWFFDVSKKEDSIKNILDDMNFIPPEEDVILRNWIVTRDKRWGISFPHWRCRCGNSFVPSKRSDLAEISDYDGKSSTTPNVISQVDLECPKCGDIMEWEGKILNPIFIQACSPWAQLGYPHDESEYKSWWPGDIFISKNAKRDDLFTATVTLSSALLGENCVKKMLMQGPVVSEIDYKDVKGLANKQGYDSLRLYMLSENHPWETHRIKGDDLQYPHPLVRVLWNLNDFLIEQIEKYDIEPGETTLESVKENMDIKDEWLLSCIESTKREVKEHYEDGRYDKVIRSFNTLAIENMAQWYFSQAKKRIDESEDEEVVKSMLKVIYDGVLSVTNLLVPIAPFISEGIYQDLNGKMDSVFMCDWPDVNELIQDQDLEKEMDEVKDIVHEIILAKQKNGVPEKWPLKEIIYKSKNNISLELVEKYEDIIKEKARVKDIDILGPEREWEKMILEVHPNEDAIGQSYKEWKSRIATMLRRRPPEDIREGIEKDEYTIGLQGQMIEIKPEMVKFKAKLPEGFHEIKMDEQDIYVDLNIYDEIWDEVMAEETMLRLKSMRSDFDLEEEDEIEVYIETSDEMSSALNDHRDIMIQGANVKELSINKNIPDEIDYIYEWEINGEYVEIGLVPLYKKKTIESFKKIPDVGEKIAEKLYEKGFTSVKLLADASASEISKVNGVKRGLARNMINSIKKIEEGEELKEETEVEKTETEIFEEETEIEDEMEREPHAPETDLSVEDKEKKMLPEGISKSSTYLINQRDSDESSSFELFKDILDTDMEGLCVTRDYPDKIREKYGLKNVEIIWLSNVDREDVIRPKSLEKFSLSIENFLARKKGVILLNGLEYLITNNEFRTVLHLIQSIKDQVAINESILLIPVNPTTLADNQMDLLSGEVDELIKP